MKKPKKEQRKYGTTWSCLECKVDLDHPEMVKHLEEVHHLNPKTTKVKSTMVMHLDGSDYYSSSYDCSIALPDGKELKLARYTCNKRTGEDAAWWGA